MAETIDYGQRLPSSYGETHYAVCPRYRYGAVACECDLIEQDIEMARLRERVRVLTEALKANIRWEHRQRFPHIKPTSTEAIGDAALATVEAKEETMTSEGSGI